MNVYDKAIKTLMECGGDASPLTYEGRKCNVLKLRGRYTDYGFQRYILIDIKMKDVISTRDNLHTLCPKERTAEWVPKSE